MLNLSDKSNPWSSEYQEYPTLMHSLLHFWNTYISWNESYIKYEQMNAIGQLCVYILDKYS